MSLKQDRARQIFKLAEPAEKKLAKPLAENHPQYKTESRLSGRKLKPAAA
jgi:hypothetical protein